MKKLIFALSFIFLSFIFCLQLEAASSKCYYKVNDGINDNHVEITISNGNVTFLPLVCNTVCHYYPSLLTTVPIEPFKVKGNDNLVYCPNLYIYKTFNDNNKLAMIITFDSKYHNYSHIWPKGIAADPDLSIISNPEYDPNDLDEETREMLKNQEDTMSITKGGELTCFGILGNNGSAIVKFFIIVIRILTPILLFLLTAAEFMKAIPAQDEDAMIKAWKKFGTRAIITVLIMLLPTFLNILGTLTGLFDSCGIW